MDSGLRRLNVAVQLRPEADESVRESVQDYLSRYYGEQRVRVYWGTAEQFGAELCQRMGKIVPVVPSLPDSNAQT